jgi:predicted membrane channel-forming protein YqfA (hemolysin III family)
MAHLSIPIIFPRTGALGASKKIHDKKLFDLLGWREKMLLYIPMGSMVLVYMLLLHDRTPHGFSWFLFH